MKTGKELIKSINELEITRGNMAFWWLGQMGYTLKIGKTIVYIDPFLSHSDSRNVAPLLEPEEVVNADYIIGTHDHGDHIDRNVWFQLSLSSPQAKFIVPGLIIESLVSDIGIPRERFMAAEDGTTILERDIRITGVASAHEFLDYNQQTGQYPYLGYVIEGNGTAIYHSGDCCIYEGLITKLKSVDKIDAMFVPINGRDAKRYKENTIGNMTYQEAVDLIGTINVGLAVPGHYEMFNSNSADPFLFSDYLDTKYHGISSWIGEHGEPVVVSRKL